MKRAIVLVMDSFGIGAAADAAKFGDEGADTFGHIAQQARQSPLYLPNLQALGLIEAHRESTGRYAQGFTETHTLTGAYTYASELSSGKDTPSGHWEMAGVPVLFDWGYFPEKKQSFPSDLLERIVKRAGIPGYLGNCHASGTDILVDLGDEHVQSGKPIFYTSVDSVFQVACHEESFGLQRLYDLCALIREEVNAYNIGRVIARPFVGERAETYQRTGNRKDLSVKPPADTVLDKLVQEKQGQVISVGKIADIFAHCGITQTIKATGLEALFDATLEAIQTAGDNTLVFTNFVDFDSSYGHRRDIQGYADALEYFDRRLPDIQALLRSEDVLFITADHGCDPTWPGTDHTREHVPILLSGSQIKPGFLGHSETFADIGQTLASHFALSPMEYGKRLF